MELKIESNVENHMLGRKEIRFSLIQDDPTPKKEEIKRELCKMLNLHPDSTIIVKVNQQYGYKESEGLAHSYKTKELLEKSEPKFILKRLSKGKKEGEAPKEEPKQEEKKEKAQNAEHVKEEKKAEPAKPEKKEEKHEHDAKKEEKPASG